jgi:hypothetical protein
VVRVKLAMAIRRKTDAAPESVPGVKDTWNSREAIVRHRALSPEQRFRRAAELSRAALRFRDAPRVDAR